jgi:hypothetical protein
LWRKRKYEPKKPLQQGAKCTTMSFQWTTRHDSIPSELKAFAKPVSPTLMPHTAHTAQISEDR